MVAKCGSESGSAPSAQRTVRTTFANIPGVLARGEGIAADAAEHLGAVFAAEQTRYFLKRLRRSCQNRRWRSIIVTHRCSVKLIHR